MDADKGPKIGLAFSGGGHRATAYCLGVLMALMDRGLNRNIVQVSSVSGGSVLNAALVQSEVDLSKLTTEQFDEIARDVAATIAYKAPLSRMWIVAALLVIFGSAGIVCYVYMLSGLAPWLLVPSAFLGAGLPMLLIGKYVEWRIGRCYMRTADRRMGSLRHTEVDHVFCTTDLLTGQPVYFSNYSQGVLCRRTGDRGVIGGIPATTTQLWSAEQFTLRSVVRASAGFPGIPPLFKKLAGKRLDRPGTFGGAVPEPAGWDGPATLFLSDGGIVNNLGTQTLREDGFFRGSTKQVPPSVLMSANASALAPLSRSWPFLVPGAATFFQFLRCLHVLNMNTVTPRVAASRIALARRAQSGAYDEEVDLIVNLTESTETLKLSLEGSIVDDRDTLRLRNPAYRKWSTGIVRILQKWEFEHRRGVPSDNEKIDLVDILLNELMEQPWSVPLVVGVMDHDALDDVMRTSWWRELASAGLGKVRVGTTLGKLKPETIRHLVMNGYMHGYIASLPIRAFGDWELDGAAKRARARIAALAECVAPKSAG